MSTTTTPRPVAGVERYPWDEDEDYTARVLREVDKREAMAAGLERLAEMIREHRDLRVPASLGSEYGPISFVYRDAEELALLGRLVGGDKHQGDRGLELHGRIDGLHVKVLPAFDAEVCERVQVGTETVEREEVVEPAKTRTVTEEVPVFEWRCPDSILRSAAADQDAA